MIYDHIGGIMRKAFITGGAGSVGSQLAKSLVDRGWQVTVVDDLSDGKIENLALSA